MDWKRCQKKPVWVNMLNVVQWFLIALLYVNINMDTVYYSIHNLEKTGFNVTAGCPEVG